MAHVYEELQAPQESINILTKQLMKDCDESQLETLEGIQIATRLMQLHIVNLLQFQRLKNDSFVSQRKAYDVN